MQFKPLVSLIIMEFSDSEAEYQSRFIVVSDSEDFEDDESISNIDEIFENLNLKDPVSKISETKIILSIDIGIKHLGMSMAEIDLNYNIIDVFWIELIDITEFQCDIDKCPLFHEKTFTDWLAHIFQNYKEFFEGADYVLIERQPITGLVAIEQMIFAAVREKAILISPNSVHKFFGMGHQSHDYDQRKVISEKIALKYIKQESIRLQYHDYERKHDISDSILFIVYWCMTTKRKKDYEQKLKERDERTRKIKRKLKNGKFVDSVEYLEQFRHVERPEL